VSERVLLAGSVGLGGNGGRVGGAFLGVGVNPKLPRMFLSSLLATNLLSHYTLQSIFFIFSLLFYTLFYFFYSLPLSLFISHVLWKKYV